MPFSAEEYLKDRFEKLNLAINKHEVQKSQVNNDLESFRHLSVEERKCFGSIKLSLDDIERGIKLSKLRLHVEPDTTKCERPQKQKIVRQPNAFIKIKLQKTPDMVLFEQRSTTVLRDTEEGRLVEEDNKLYEYLIEGLGRQRTCFPIETQTVQELTKTRGVNTDTIARNNVASYVSNFEMFDTYKDLEKTTTSLDVNGTQKIQVTTYKVGGVDQFVKINRLPAFKLALMLTTRILAGNNFENEQRRFRNMVTPDLLALQVRYSYRLQALWSYVGNFGIAESCSVADLSWCPKNGDILAVAYGAFNSMRDALPKTGSVFIWSIKNPINPERIYTFQAPVITVEFSTFCPQLLAVGLYDGSIFVYDIKKSENPEISSTSRSPSASYEPITSIKWFKHNYDGSGHHDLTTFLGLTRDGIVNRYTLVNGPKLLIFEVMKFDRIDGEIMGLEIAERTFRIEAHRHPQSLFICLNPLQKDVFYVLTDEGCCHKCSLNLPNQQLEVLQLHEAGVNHMEFSPWSPKLYLTCGNDWCIRIWLVGISKPLITLKHHMEPVHAASWSTTHSSIIVALHGSSLDIWDLKRSILKPASSSKVNKESFYTTFKLSLCGRSVALGNNKGVVEMLAFEEMPFQPHFQYDQLQNTIYKLLANERELLKAVKNLGYFGY